MKKSILSLLVCAALSCSASAETVSNIQLAQEGISYDSIVVKLKPDAKSTDATVLTALPEITQLDPSLVATSMFQADKLRGEASAEMIEMNKRYGFDRFLRIKLPDNKSKDQIYINKIIAGLEHDQNIEEIYPEALPVTLEVEDQTETTQTPTRLRSTQSSNLGAINVPDFRQQQDYLKSTTEKRTGYYMGGINRDSVNQYKGSDGEGITIISSENCGWNDKHVNLPPMALAMGPHSDTCKEREHNTASVGILAGQDIGTGIRGIAWKSKVGYAAWPASNLYNTIPYLKAGDVVSLNMQYWGGEVTGTCQKDCFVPVENLESYYSVIKALTDKGVFVISSAGNGNINLDSPAFNGKWDTNIRDSGAIIAGAFCAKSGLKAWFSSYGSRVTSSSWGCNDVVTTGYGPLYNAVNATYTNSFGGTSSSTPILAGVVASLSGIAKANGITVTPKQMRQILAETGTTLANGNSAVVGTQPDMERAVAKILALKNGDNTQPAPTAAAGADYTMVSPTSGVSVYPLDGSQSRNAKSYTWSVTKGTGTFFVQEKLNGTQVNSVNSAHAYAVIPANTEGDATFTLTTTGADGRTAQDSMTIHVTKPAAPVVDDTPAKDETPAKDDTPSQDTPPAKDEPVVVSVPAYNAKIAYPTKCTKVSHNGKIWFNQWYVNPGQEEPGKGGTWGVWRTQGATGNSCK